MEQQGFIQNVLSRLAEFKECTGLTLNAFAGKIGMKHATLHNQFHGKRDLSLETIVNTLSTYEELSAEWLLRGSGEMYNVAPSVTSEAEQKNDARLDTLIETIKLLQDTIKVKNDTIDSLQEQLNRYKSKKQ